MSDKMYCHAQIVILHASYQNEDDQGLSFLNDYDNTLLCSEISPHNYIRSQNFAINVKT